VQNDSSQPVASLHLGVNGSGDRVFAFDGDGVCWTGVLPRPAECPFGALTYDGPDAELSAESPDAGTVSFPEPLRPGQYTYFTLEAPPRTGIVAGAVNDVVVTTLTNTKTHDSGETLGAPSPTPFVDRAVIESANEATVTGTVEYVLYSDANCKHVIEFLGKQGVVAGVAQPSDPSSAHLPTNATYYWVAKYSGNAHNLPNSSACGSETMTFGFARTAAGAAGSVSNDFSFVGPPRVNAKTGQILIGVILPATGVATASAVVKPSAHARATAASKHKCKRGAVRRHRRCVSGALAAFGSSSLDAPAAGSYTIVVSPNKQALAALREGKTLNVTVPVTYRSRLGGAPVTHAQSALVKLIKPQHGRH
jgi:hypothetical protein